MPVHNRRGKGAMHGGRGQKNRERLEGTGEGGGHHGAGWGYYRDRYECRQHWRGMGTVGRGKGSTREGYG